MIISKGNVTIVKEARLVNRQFDYICATAENDREDDASDHSDPEESTSSAAATTITATILPSQGNIGSVVTVVSNLTDQIINRTISSKLVLSVSLY